MDDGARGWLIRAAVRNHWRVSKHYDLDDLIQEGYWAYYETLRRYPDAVDPPHRMALFKLVYMSVITDMANKRTRSVHEVSYADLAPKLDGASAGDRVDAFLETLVAEPDISLAAANLALAPKYVKDALALFTTEDGLRRLRSAYRKTPVGRWLKRETLNERLCRLTGYDPREVDIVGGLRALVEQ